jgi:hypothetical protein
MSPLSLPSFLALSFSPGSWLLSHCLTQLVPEPEDGLVGELERTAVGRLLAALSHSLGPLL